MTGSAMLPVMAAGMSGIARIEATVTKTVMMPILTITPTMARGTFLAGSRTSSAIEPAASKPRKVQPMKAMPPNHPIQSQLKPLLAVVLYELVNVEKSWTRKKKKRTMARTSVVLSSANSRMLTKNFRTDCATLLIARPMTTITIASRIGVSLEASVMPIPGRMKLAAAYAHVVMANTIVHQ